MKLDIVSLKFSPGLLKEVLCLRMCGRKEGAEVTTFLAHGYGNMLGENPVDTGVQLIKRGFVSSLKAAFSIGLKRSDAVLLYNSHPFNPILLFFSVILCWSKKRVFVCHEPMKEAPFKHYGSYGWMVLLIEILNKITSWLATDVVVLSPRGRKLYERSVGYSRLAKLHEARILLPPTNEEKERRCYHTFLGNVVATKKVDWFLNLAKEAHRSGVMAEFLIVSSSTLPMDEIRQLQNAGVHLNVVNPSPLTDEEISKWLSQSKAVFSMHRSVTQSGVFVECMRHGTPVVCFNEEGFSQFISDCGVLVDNPDDVDEMLKASDQINLKLSHMEKSAIAIFNKEFNCKNFLTYYSFLF